MGRPKPIPKEKRPLRDVFQRDLLGDVAFDFEREDYRGSRYLLRNIKRVLRLHEKRFKNIGASESNLSSDLKNGNSFSRIKSFGGNSSRTSVSVARVLPAKQDINDLPSWSEMMKDSSVIIYESPFARKVMLLNITRLCAKSHPIPDPIFDSQKKQPFKCTVSVLLLEKCLDVFRLVEEQSKECLLVMSSMNMSIKIESKEPFILKSGAHQWSQSQLEIRLSPVKDDQSNWPPTDVLPKLDHSYLPLMMGPEHDTFPIGLVAKCTDLPLFASGRKRLKMVHADYGLARKTRHELEVLVDWIVPPQQPLERIEQWPSGRSALSKLGDPARERLNQKAREVVDSIGIRTSYTLATTEERKHAAELRRQTFDGFHCLFCLGKCADFANIRDLRFHLSTSHPAHNFILQEPKSKVRRKDDATNNFEVSSAIRKPEKLTDWHTRISWVAPTIPLNINAFISGDETWVDTKSTRSLKELPVSTSQKPIIALRKKHHGFLPAQYVPEIPIRQRKTYLVVPTKTRKNLPLFTSVTHRPLQPDEELSESDDEVDETWLRDKHAQQIMDLTHLPLAEREFQIRWNDHVKSERLPHTFYLSDVFVRWVRKDCEWLRASKERLLLYHQFERGLRDRGNLSDGVCRGCWGILYGKTVKLPAEKEAVAATAMENDGI